MPLSHLPKAHQAEYEERGRISCPEFHAAPTHNVLTFPLNPFDYTKWLSQGSIGSVPSCARGTRVAIIGAGAAGLCAAYELMKIGLVPVIYEASDRLGGRIHSQSVEGDSATVLEMGAMRIPAEQEVFAFYQNEFKLESKPFPNPGNGADTMLWFEKERIRWKKGDKAPAIVADVNTKFDNFLIGTMKAAGAGSTSNDPTHLDMLKTWTNLVAKFEQSSLLSAMTSTDKWTSKELAILGALGSGSGGLSAQLHVAALEMYRAALGMWLNDQLILGNGYGTGLESLPNTLYRQVVETVEGATSVEQMQEGQHCRGGVTAIRKTANGRGVEIEDVDGNREVFAATILTCTTRAMQLGIHIDDELLTTEEWGALARLHYMSATKIACHSKTKFWLDEDIPPVTITDRPTRSSYFLDYGDQAKGGALILSYTWGDDSNKLMALSKDQQVAMCREVLGELYGDAFTKQEFTDFSVISWQQESGYNGAFRLSYPAQYEDHNALFNQSRASIARQCNDGLFLSGEGVSWEGAWIDGALQAGLDASASVIRLLGGKLSI